MKKVLITTSITTIFAFANEPQVQVLQIPAGCIESKLSEVTSLLSCPSAEYKVIFSTYTDGSRNIKERVVVEKIGEIKPIIIQQISK